MSGSGTRELNAASDDLIDTLSPACRHQAIPVSQKTKDFLGSPASSVDSIADIVAKTKP